MKNNEINKIVQELAEIDKDFAENKDKLYDIIASFVEVKPDIQIDKEFRNRLKNKLKKRTQLDTLNYLEQKQSSISWFQRIFGSFAFGTVISIVVFGVYLSSIGSYENNDKTNYSVRQKSWVNLGLEISYTNQNLNVNKLWTKEQSTPWVGGSEMLESKSQDMAIQSSSIPTEPEFLGGYYSNYKYEYVWEGIQIPEDLLVYEHETNWGFSDQLWGILSVLDIDSIDLDMFEDLSVESISLKQKNGYRININSKKWHVDIIWNGNNDLNRNEYDNFDLDDVMSKDQLVSNVNKFLDEYNIDISDSYNEIVLDDSWKENLHKSSERAYIPKTARLVFPIDLEGYEVYDLWGKPEGLQVAYNMVTDKVTSFGPLKSIYLKAFESNMYSSIKPLVDKINSKNWQSMDKDITVQLENAKLVYTSMYRYDQGRQIQYYVPAVYFDTNTESQDIWLPDSMVLPLVDKSSL